MPETQVTPAGIVTFWRDAGPDRWYTPDDAFDAEVRRRFLDLWRQAAAGGLSSWETSDDGALALVIVLDQFPRNMFRGDARTYASDALAREVASRAIDGGLDARIDPQLREFLYLPFAVSSYRERRALPKARNGPSTTPGSSGASAASPTATASWDARPRPRSRPFWMTGAFRPDDGSVNSSDRCRFELHEYCAGRLPGLRNIRSFMEN